MRYGFIGCGNLGQGLAGSLLRAGYAVTVHDRDPEAATSLLDAGAAWAETPVIAATGAGAVITCLPSPQVSEAVLESVLPAMDKGATWIETSTVSREDILRLSAKARAHSIDTLECPVTGGVHLARSGEITVLAGGEDAVFERHRPALEAMGGRVFRMGPVGSASLIKVITNMLAFIHLQACGEALMLAKRGGLDLAQSWAAIQASSGNSFVHETEGQLILNGSYDIAFTMDLALKDLGFAEAFGADFGVPLKLAMLTKSIFEDAKDAYGGDAQSPMIAKLLEDALGTDLRAEGFPERL